MEGGAEQSWPGSHLWLVIFPLIEPVYTACLSCHCVFYAFLHRLRLHLPLQVAHVRSLPLTLKRGGGIADPRIVATNPRSETHANRNRVLSSGVEAHRYKEASGFLFRLSSDTDWRTHLFEKRLKSAIKSNQ